MSRICENSLSLKGHREFAFTEILEISQFRCLFTFGTIPLSCFILTLSASSWKCPYIHVDLFCLFTICVSRPESMLMDGFNATHSHTGRLLQQPSTHISFTVSNVHVQCRYGAASVNGCDIQSHCIF